MGSPDCIEREALVGIYCVIKRAVGIGHIWQSVLKAPGLERGITFKRFDLFCSWSWKQILFWLRKSALFLPKTALLLRSYVRNQQMIYSLTCSHRLSPNQSPSSITSQALQGRNMSIEHKFIDFLNKCLL